MLKIMVRKVLKMGFRRVNVSLVLKGMAVDGRHSFSMSVTFA